MNREVKAEVEQRVARLRAEFAAGSAETRRRILGCAHSKDRFENYDPDAESLSDADARLLIANQEGYAFWSKYESYINLDGNVRAAIEAVRAGDLAGLRAILKTDASAANPHWVTEYAPPKPIPNDSIPLFCVSEGVFRRTNTQGNEYELTRALTGAGANMTIEGDIVLSAATSFNTPGVAEALLDAGAPIDGVDGDGVPIAYCLHFGFTGLCELMARRGAKLDLRSVCVAGSLDEIQKWFEPDGSLKPGAGALADPYGQEWKYRGESPFRCERTRENMLSQALYFTIVHGRLDVADFLLTQGAPINAYVPGLDIEYTVLHRARTPEIVRFLLARGADRTMRDRSHHGTPLDWARHAGRQDLMDALS